MEWFFYNTILPNWLLIIIGFSVLYKLGSIHNTIIYELYETIGDEVRSIHRKVKSVESDLGKINWIIKTYYYNSLGLGRELAVYNQRKALAEAVFKKAEAEALGLGGRRDDLGYDSDSEAWFIREEALDMAEAVLKEALDMAEAVLKKAEAEAWADRRKAEKNKDK